MASLLSGEKPSACTKCDNTFKQICGLKEHEKTNTGEKPFTCTKCDKTFKQG